MEETSPYHVFPPLQKKTSNLSLFSELRVSQWNVVRYFSNFRYFSLFATIVTSQIIFLVQNVFCHNVEGNLAIAGDRKGENKKTKKNII